MLEDKLDPNERRRLEAIAQSIASSQSEIMRTGDSKTNHILARAKKFDHFIQTGKVDES